jgi:hypothetical protein
MEARLFLKAAIEHPRAASYWCGIWALPGK